LNATHDLSAADVVVVGAGFAGLYALHRLRRAARSAIVLEAAPDVGGTWFWNRYPGARCDVESFDYCYGFDAELLAEWHWTERFPTQPEVLAYLRHVAERFDLRRDIRFDTRVISAHFDEPAARWTVTTDDGSTIRAGHLIMATGVLSAAKLPEIEGVQRFAGRSLHTAAWPDEPVDFGGRRVGVIGTGSSGVQSIPLIAEQAEQLVVFQRTANFSVPAHNRRWTDDEITSMRSRYVAYKAAARGSFTGIGDIAVAQTVGALDELGRRAAFEHHWEVGGTGFLRGFTDLLTDEQANAAAGEFVAERIRQIVDDPQVADRLIPTSHPIGTKRICVDTDYYATFRRANVTLVDLRREPIERIEPTGVVTTAGAYELDDLVFATGFDAMTGALARIDIRGRDGLPLSEAWVEGPRMFLGTAVSGFPNMHVVTGPGSPSVLTNMATSIERHVEWITQLVQTLHEQGARLVEADPDAEARWVAHVAAAADLTLFPRADSWYVGANVPGKPRRFMAYVGGLGPFSEHCDDVAAAGYAGFRIDDRPAAPYAPPW
jgi:cyclohexanone monooxygenase